MSSPPEDEDAASGTFLHTDEEEKRYTVRTARVRVRENADLRC
jgi:hypothetical protein